jgi:hypothetical protein
MNAARRSTIEPSPEPIQTANGFEHVFLVTSETGQQYRYVGSQYTCDAKTHLKLASETSCLRCPKCQQSLFRSSDESGLNFVRLETRGDAESVLQILTGANLQTMTPDKRIAASITKTQLLQMLGRGPEMLGAAQLAYGLQRSATSAKLLADANFVNGMLRQPCDLYREAYRLLTVFRV